MKNGRASDTFGGPLFFMRRTDRRNRGILLGGFFLAAALLIVSIARRAAQLDGKPETDRIPFTNSSAGLLDGRSSSPVFTPPGGSRALTGELAPIDPSRKRVDSLLGILAADADGQGTGFENALAELTKGEVLEALNTIEDATRSDAHRELRHRLIQRLAEVDPKSAAEILSASLSLPGRRETVKAVAGIWARQNPEEALAWVRQLSQGDEQNQGILGIAYELVATRPIDALKIAPELHPGESRNELVSLASGEWASRDPAAAVEWARGISEGPMRETALAAIATAWAESEPALAARLAVESLTPGKTQNDAAVSIVQQWTVRNPAEAGSWIANFPEGELRETALTAFVKTWADRDLEQAGRWVTDATLSDSSRDAAIAAYTGKALTQSPDTAIQWANQIKNANLRLRNLEVIGENWMASDPAAARVWIAKAPFSEASKARLLTIQAD